MSSAIQDTIFDTKLKLQNLMRDPSFTQDNALAFLEEQVNLSTWRNAVLGAWDGSNNSKT